MNKKHTESRRLTRADLVRCVPYWGIYAGCGLVYFAGYSHTALIICILSYLLRMFAITGFYHRYFSHKTFKTGRFTQFVFALIGASSGQRGPLWWAAHHRLHHRHADTVKDVHSPVQHGFWWSHMLWFVSEKNFQTESRHIQDFARFPELDWLNRYDLFAPFAYGFALCGLGYALEVFAPSLGATALQVVVWGFFISTVLLHQMTFCVNSLAHKIGARPYPTKDDSRNNWFIALVTLGEGWHNNHHFYPASTRQGFHWWQVDVTYWLLLAMSRFGLVWDLTPVPAHIANREPATPTPHKAGVAP